MYRIITSFICLIAATSLACASTISYVGPATSVNDGSFWVLPYQVTIDGVSQLVDCYDILDDVTAGDTWQANILTLSQAATSGFFTNPNELADYERVAWLSAQAYTGTAQQVGLQHAIWNVFGSVSDDAQSQAYESAADSAAATGYSGFDFSSYRFIQQAGAVAGGKGVEQAFIFQDPHPTPEPGTIVLFGGAAALYACVNCFRRVRR